MSRGQSGLVLCVFLGACVVMGAEDNDFHRGIEGELYYAARVDLVPGDVGGPLTIELDGELDEVAYNAGLTELRQSRGPGAQVFLRHLRHLRSRLPRKSESPPISATQFENRFRHQKDPFIDSSADR